MINSYNIGEASKNICLLVENSTHTTGAFKSALAITTLLRNFYEVEWVIPAHASDEIISNLTSLNVVYHQLPMLEIGRSWKKILAYIPILIINYLRLRDLVHKRNVNIVINNDYYNLLGVLLKFFGWKGVLITYVRLLPRNQFFILSKTWEWLTCKFSSHVIAVSFAVKSDLNFCSRSIVIYDPIGLEINRNDEFEIKNFNEKNIKFLYLSNYIEGKGHAFALSAFAEAYRVRRDIRLRFVGGDLGLSKNRALRRKLEAEAIFLGLQNVVSFDEYIADVKSMILESDILLNFSDSESFSRTCLEASAYGRPVIVTRCGGPEEIVEQGVSGFLVQKGEVLEMCDAMLRLACDQSLRNLMGLAGRDIVGDKFSDSKFLDAFLPLFRNEKN